MVETLQPEQLLAFAANAREIPGFTVRHDIEGLDLEAGGGETINELVPVYTTILPAGTLLFRAIRGHHQIFTDFLGMPKPAERKYCLPLNYNVFFYPFPFVDETIGENFTAMIVYVLVHDVEVACMINPVPMTRGDKAMPENPIQPCSKVTYGCGTLGRAYDPCFRDRFLKNNPSVTGMIAIAAADREVLIAQLAVDGMESGLGFYYNKFFSLYTDSHSLLPGVPEIILYPRKTRAKKETKVSMGLFGDTFNPDAPTPADVSNLFAYVRQKPNIYSYKMYSIIPRQNARDIIDLIDQGFAKPDAAPGARLPTMFDYPIRIDKTTGFLVTTAYYRGPPENLEADRNRLGELFPQFKFHHGVIPEIETMDMERFREVSAALVGMVQPPPGGAGPAAAGAGGPPPGGAAAAGLPAPVAAPAPPAPGGSAAAGLPAPPPGGAAAAGLPAPVAAPAAPASAPGGSAAAGSGPPSGGRRRRRTLRAPK
jgi:hypothetical protein